MEGHLKFNNVNPVCKDSLPTLKRSTHGWDTEEVTQRKRCQNIFRRRHFTSVPEQLNVAKNKRV